MGGKELLQKIHGMTFRLFSVNVALLTVLDRNTLFPETRKLSLMLDMHVWKCR